MSGRTLSERGQAALETAIMFPLVVLTLAGIIQAGWMVYSYATLSSAVEHAQYSLTPEMAADAADVNALVADAIKETSPVLSTGTLSVTNAKVDNLPATLKSEQLGDDEFLDYGFASKNEITQRILVTAHIEYKPVVFVGVLSDIKYIREVEANRILSERFELG